MRHLWVLCTFWCLIYCQLSPADLMCDPTTLQGQLNYVCKWYKAWVGCPDSLPSCEFLSPYVNCSKTSVEKITMDIQGRELRDLLSAQFDRTVGSMDALFSRFVLFLPNIHICLPGLKELTVDNDVIPTLVKFKVGPTSFDSLDSIFSLLNLEVLSMKLTIVGDITKAPFELIQSMDEVAVVPETLGRLTKLRVLFLGIGEKAPMPKALDNLVNLEELVLYRNASTSHTALPDFSKLPKLRKLGLSGFNFTQVPESLKTLASLESLDLSICGIAGTFPLFAPNLRELILRRNRITQFEAGASRYWTKLQTLVISHNMFQVSLEEVLFPSLKQLHVEQNNIKGTIPVQAGLQLIRLTADKNALSGTLSPVLFLQNGTLKTLTASYNSLTGPIPWVPQPYTLPFEYLDLGYNELEGTLAPLDAFYLKELVLSSNKISGTLPNRSNFPWINKLYIRNNNLVGGVPAFWFDISEKVYIEKLSRRVSRMDGVDFSGQRIGGGCFALDIDWKFGHCDLGDARFFCDCAPTTLCGTKRCYTTTDPCGDPELNFCSEGAKCVNNATSHWYNCFCDTENYIQTDIYTCVAKNPCKLYGCGDNAICRQPVGEEGSPKRICTCLPGFVSDMNNKTMVGNVTFSGCQVTDPCIAPGCDGRPNVNCSLIGRDRNCTCHPGYRVSNEVNATFLIMKDKTSATFPGCQLIDMCLKHSCNGDLNAKCVWTHPNERQCVCEKGYTPSNLVTLIGDQPFKGCKEIMACEQSGCRNPDNSTIATCKESIEDKRFCECPPGYAGTLQLSLDQPFPGCIDFPECIWRCDSHSTCKEEKPNERTCTCDEGWEGTATIIGNQTFSGCIDIDECADQEACPQGNQCNNTPGSFLCTCMIGYTRSDQGGSECYIVKDDSSSIIGPVAGAIAAGVIIVLLLGAYYWFWVRPRQALKNLPPAVRWHFQKYFDDPRSYRSEGSGSSKYFSKLLRPESDVFRSVLEMWSEFFESSLNPQEIYAIYSPSLVHNFVNHKELIKTRMVDQPLVFNSKKWKNGKDGSVKQMIYNFFEHRLEAAWNMASTTDVVPIIPAVHATDFVVANSICATGFVALSSLDAGYYGKGIYFSTFANYTLPYLVRHEDPAILISFLACGNTYPVSQHHHAPNSLMGKPIQSGYNSHYVVVAANGEVPPAMDTPKLKLYDELVVAQEAQIAPAYLIRLRQQECNSLMKKWIVQMDACNGFGDRVRDEETSSRGMDVGGTGQATVRGARDGMTSEMSLSSSDMYVPLLDMSQG